MYFKPQWKWVEKGTSHWSTLGLFFVMRAIWRPMSATSPTWHFGLLSLKTIFHDRVLLLNCYSWTNQKYCWYDSMLNATFLSMTQIRVTRNKTYFCFKAYSTSASIKPQNISDRLEIKLILICVLKHPCEHNVLLYMLHGANVLENCQMYTHSLPLLALSN